MEHKFDSLRALEQEGIKWLFTQLQFVKFISPGSLLGAVIVDLILVCGLGGSVNVHYHRCLAPSDYGCSEVVCLYCRRYVLAIWDPSHRPWFYFRLDE